MRCITVASNTLTEAKIAIADTTYYYDKLYSYHVPAALKGRVFVGGIVLVPFGRGRAKPRVGVVIELNEVTSTTYKLRDIIESAPPEATLSQEMLNLVKYLKETIFCTWFDAVKAVLPAGAQYKAERQDGRWQLRRNLQKSYERFYHIIDPAIEAKTQKQKDVLAFLANGKETLTAITEACGVTESVLKTLQRYGAVEPLNIEVDKITDYNVTYVPERLLMQDDEQTMQLTDEQRHVADALKEQMAQEKSKTALLHGVTGSGKTAVFLELTKHTLQQGKAVLILVPEIGLTPQMIAQLQAGFGDQVAVQHSRLSDTERLAQWQAIEAGRATIVVGTRSAVFAPLANIGLIVVDEEQEHTYQSEQSPRYDAIQMARLRAAYHGALLLLASATPSLESYFKAQQGQYTLHQLQERYGNLPLPEVSLIDMNQELLDGHDGILSRPLKQAIFESIENDRQVILLLNRRGFLRVGQCRRCGHVIKCDDCSVPMVFHAAHGDQATQQLFKGRLEKTETPTHRSGNGNTIRWSGAGAPAENGAVPAAQPSTAKKGAGEPTLSALVPSGTDLPPNGHLQCHYCGRREYDVPTQCPECEGNMMYSGFGTQRIEQELQTLFPKARVLRMDLDSTSRKGHHEKMLNDFSKGEFDILLGTQMVAKGLDFERVNLVGVVGIDSLLNSHSYRAYESVFSLLTQVVGRSGRANAPGRAMIQSGQVDSPVLQLAAKQDYEAFYQDEIGFREMGLYPPFCSLCTVGFVAEKEADAVSGAQLFSSLFTEMAKKQPNIPLRVLGPAPMSIIKIGGVHRYRLTIKCRNDKTFRDLMRAILQRYHKEGGTKKANTYIDFHFDS